MAAPVPLGDGAEDLGDDPCGTLEEADDNECPPQGVFQVPLLAGGGLNSQQDLLLRTLHRLPERQQPCTAVQES